MKKTEPDDKPGLWRLSVAARMAGMPVASFRDACLNGRIPVELIVVSERASFVRVSQFKNWLNGGTQ